MKKITKIGLKSLFLAAMIFGAIGFAKPAGAATATNCNLATGSAKNNLCFVDFGSANVSSLLGSGGQDFAVKVGNGFTLSFNVKFTSGDMGMASIQLRSAPLVGQLGGTNTSALGNTAYTGLSSKILDVNASSYHVEGATSSRSSGNAANQVVSNIKLIDPNGAAVSGWKMFVADAEEVTPNENSTLSSSSALNLLEQMASASSDPAPICGSGGAGGIGSTQITCGQDTAGKNSPGANIYTTTAPTSLSMKYVLQILSEEITPVDSGGSGVCPNQVCETPASTYNLTGTGGNAFAFGVQMDSLPKVCKANFDSKGGTKISGQTLVGCSHPTKPANPLKPDNIFDGWTNCDTGKDYDFSANLSGDVNICAKWTPIWDVNFNTDGGNEIQDQYIPDQKTANKPDDPTKDNQDFVGWVECETKKEYDFSAKISDDLQLCAQWKNKETGAITTDPILPENQKIGVPATGIAALGFGGAIALLGGAWLFTKLTGRRII